jgi:hypothetical protein
LTVINKRDEDIVIVEPRTLRVVDRIPRDVSRAVTIEPQGTR